MVQIARIQECWKPLICLVGQQKLIDVYDDGGFQDHYSRQRSGTWVLEYITYSSPITDSSLMWVR